MDVFKFVSCNWDLLNSFHLPFKPFFSSFFFFILKNSKKPIPQIHKHTL